MLWKPFKNKKKEYKPKASELFLKKCWVLIAWWIFILLLMIGLAVMVDLTGGSSKTWARGLFVASCILDILITCKILPGVFRILKDDLAKESFVKKKIWKLRFLLFVNLFFSLSFVAWIWMAKDGDTGQKIIKWLLCVVLAMGVLLIKFFFVHTFIVLKRYISKLFVEFKVLDREEHIEPEDIAFSPRKEEPANLLEANTDPSKILT